MKKQSVLIGVSYWTIPGLKKSVMPRKNKTLVLSNKDCVFAIVCGFYGVSIDELKSPRRTGNLSMARHVAVWLLYKYVLRSSKAVGEIFNRDHTTVLNSLKVVGDLTDTDPVIRNEVENLEYKLLIYQPNLEKV